MRSNLNHVQKHPPNGPFSFDFLETNFCFFELCLVAIDNSQLNIVTLGIGIVLGQAAVQEQDILTLHQIQNHFFIQKWGNIYIFFILNFASAPLEFSAASKFSSDKPP